MFLNMRSSAILRPCVLKDVFLISRMHRVQTCENGALTEIPEELRAAGVWKPVSFKQIANT